MIVLLLAVMSDLKGGAPKREVIEKIEHLKWFDLKPGDNTPYPSVSKEPRWKTLVAFGRKDCYEEELFVRDGVRDSWQISKVGINTFHKRRSLFESGDLDCSRCYMWSQAFKKFIKPSYSPSSGDADRPSDIYKDYHRRDVMSRIQKYLDLYSKNDVNP